jgi:hypothetical protein
MPMYRDAASGAEGGARSIAPPDGHDCHHLERVCCSGFCCGGFCCSGFCCSGGGAPAATLVSLACAAALHSHQQADGPAAGPAGVL